MPVAAVDVADDDFELAPDADEVDLELEPHALTTAAIRNKAAIAASLLVRKA